MEIHGASGVLAFMIIFYRPRMGTDEHEFLSRSDFWLTRNTQKAQKGCIAMLATGRRKRRVVAF